MLIRSTAFIIRHGDNMRMKIMKQNALDFSEPGEHNTQKIDTGRTKDQFPVRCKHFARLWPTIDLCSSKMMIAEVSGGSTLNYSPGETCSEPPPNRTIHPSLHPSEKKQTTFCTNSHVLI